MEYDVFMSYSSKDRKFAIQLKAELYKIGVRCWRDKDDLLSGTSFLDEIAEALDSVQIMVLVFSSKAMDSKYVRSELEYAFEKSMHIIPIRTEDVEPQKAWKIILGGKHWEDAIGPSKERMTEIARKIKKNVDIFRSAKEGVNPYKVAVTGKQRQTGDDDQLQGEQKLLNALYVAYEDGNIRDIERDTINSIAMRAGISHSRLKELESKVCGDLGLGGPNTTVSSESQAERGTIFPKNEVQVDPHCGIESSGFHDLISSFPEDTHDFLRSLANTGLSSGPTISIAEVRNLVGDGDYGKDIQRWLYSAYPVKRGMYFNPLVIERVLSSFTKRQQEFLRALVAEGYGGNEVLTASDVESVLKERKRMNWPQWLRTTSEFTHPKRGFYQNPIQVRLKAFFSQIEQEPIAQNEPFLGEQSENLPLEEGDQGVTESPRLAERSKLNSFDEFVKELDPRNELADFVAIIKLIHDDVLKTFPDVRVSYSKTRISFFNDAFPRRAKSFLTLGVWTPPVRIRIEKERTDEELPQGAVEDWYKKSQWMAFNFHINRSEEYSEKVKEYIRRNYQRAMEGKSL